MLVTWEPLPESMETTPATPVAAVRARPSVDAFVPPVMDTLDVTLRESDVMTRSLDPLRVAVATELMTALICVRTAAAFAGLAKVTVSEVEPPSMAS